jgi:hypothetical protein
MRILRPQPEPGSPAPHAPAVPPSAEAGAGRLRCRVRLADGRLFTGALAPERHRAIQLGLLHADSAELVELTPGTRGLDGRLALDRRRRAEHYLPGGASGRRDWLQALLEHAERILCGGYATRRAIGDPREEAFVGVAPRTRARGDKHAVAHTRLLWVDVDLPGRLPALWALLAERPCHLLIESGGSGGAHAYWKLAAPLPASGPHPVMGDVTEPIEQAHLRLIHRLGVDEHGRPEVADPACKERSRVMRLAGTVNYKTGQYARIVEADLHLPAYRIEDLVGDLPDPQPPTITRRAPGANRRDDPYKRIAPPEYFARLAGITVPARGLVSCPAKGHEDRHPSCSVGSEPGSGWCCHSGSCGARGAIYDLASVLDGGPWGRELRGEAFTRARARVREAFGELR